MLGDDFYRQLGESEYGKQYLALIDSARDRNLKPEKGYERHHIHSRALGGGNEDENLVKLTIFEHCIAHFYLAKAIPCWKTLYPILKLSGKEVRDLSDLERLTLEEVCNWSLLREEILHMPKPLETVEKLRTSHLGKKHTERQKQKASERMTGTVLINNGQDQRYVKATEIDQYLQAGWVKGQTTGCKVRTPEHLKKLNHRGMISINNGKVGKLIYPEELDQWLAQGWVRGRTPAAKARISQGHKGLEGTSTGYKAVHRGDETRKVKAAEVDQYLAEGWQLGESELICKKRREGKLNAPTNIGRVRIKKDGVGKVVPKDELQSYLDQGWVLGIVRK